jgi:hypothetical protein
LGALGLGDDADRLRQQRAVEAQQRLEAHVSSGVREEVARMLVNEQARALAEEFIQEAAARELAPRRIQILQKGLLGNRTKRVRGWVLRDGVDDLGGKVEGQRHVPRIAVTVDGNWITGSGRVLSFGPQQNVDELRALAVSFLADNG